jgi:hypothetical protein
MYRTQRGQCKQLCCASARGTRVRAAQHAQPQPQKKERVPSSPTQGNAQGWVQLRCGSAQGWVQLRCGSAQGWVQLRCGNAQGWVQLRCGNAASEVIVKWAAHIHLGELRVDRLRNSVHQPRNRPHSVKNIAIHHLRRLQLGVNLLGTHVDCRRE